MTSDRLRGSGKGAGAAQAAAGFCGKQGLATVRIRRFDPAADSEPYYQEFVGIPFKDRSVLGVLQTIYEEHDPSLAYRTLCTRGFCGGCFLVVNGEPVLACQYPAQPQMTIEPHPKFPVIRDLVVDVQVPLLSRTEKQSSSLREDVSSGQSGELST